MTAKSRYKKNSDGQRRCHRKYSVLEAKLDASKDSVLNLFAYHYSSTYTTNDVHPDFSLPIFIRVFHLAIELRISSLEELSVAKFRHVNNLEVFFPTAKSIYAHKSSSYDAGEHTGLPLAVVEAAVSEMASLLVEKLRERFFQCTEEVPDCAKMWQGKNHRIPLNVSEEM